MPRFRLCRMLHTYSGERGEKPERGTGFRVWEGVNRDENSSAHFQPLQCRVQISHAHTADTRTGDVDAKHTHAHIHTYNTRKDAAVPDGDGTHLSSISTDMGGPSSPSLLLLSPGAYSLSLMAAGGGCAAAVTCTRLCAVHFTRQTGNSAEHCRAGVRSRRCRPDPRTRIQSIKVAHVNFGSKKSDDHSLIQLF